MSQIKVSILPKVVCHGGRKRKDYNSQRDETLFPASDSRRAALHLQPTTPGVQRAGYSVRVPACSPPPLAYNSRRAAPHGQPAVSRSAVKRGDFRQRGGGWRWSQCRCWPPGCGALPRLTRACARRSRHEGENRASLAELCARLDTSWIH
ncbi:hypothetical protein scyTo_0011990 [Scyliorhinus torazame]|uniref:Uncharacterized protein n=1 Tax=Scyliorhinus torazame TaxID=75743 RepID=A0A401NZL9_SCYTO|nr:hypothetical protein [Scyliorhinus torazame]